MFNLVELIQPFSSLVILYFFLETSFCNLEVKQHGIHSNGTTRHMLERNSHGTGRCSCSLGYNSIVLSKIFPCGYMGTQVKNELLFSVNFSQWTYR